MIIRYESRIFLRNICLLKECNGAVDKTRYYGMREFF
jgi:hypothetical protein